MDVDIKLPPEDSTSDLIINGKAPFGIYFQDSMAKKLDKGAEITAVAAIARDTILQVSFLRNLQGLMAPRIWLERNTVLGMILWSWAC